MENQKGFPKLKMVKEEKHFQGCKKPTICPKCRGKDIIVTLTEDKFWKIKCKCYSEPMYL